MTYVLLFIFFGLGLIIGSFLNVVIFRLNTGRGFRGRSGCLVCQNILAWYDLVPLVSYFALRGRCRSCKSRISVQYPLVEFITGIFFVALFLKMSGMFFADIYVFSASYAYFAAMFSLLVVIAVYDLRHKVIPDSLSFAFAVLSFAGLFLFSENIFSPHLPSLADFSSGLVLSIPFALLWFLSKGKWVGLGDAKLLLGLGWFLGFPQIFSAGALAFWLGAMVAVPLLVFKKYGLRSEVPFAPFLVLSSIIVFIFELNFFPPTF